MGPSSPIILATITLLLFGITTINAHPQSQGSNGLPTPSTIESMPCSRNEECSAKFTNSDCRNKQFCQCAIEYIADGRDCIPIIQDFTTKCIINAQCAGLGDLSRCNDDSHMCECFDTRGNGRNSTVFGSLKCYYRRSLGEHCDIDEECKASIGPSNATRCETKRRICICNEGQHCENLPGGATSSYQTVSFLTIVLITLGATNIIY